VGTANARPASRIPDADDHLRARRRTFFADHHDRAVRVGGGVTADGSEGHRGERAAAPGADDQHERALAGVGNRLGGSAIQRVGVYQHPW
jgi:hypothetical protein